LVSIKAQVLKVRSMNLGKSHRKIYEVVIHDSSGRISCKYFRVPYRGYFERFQPGLEVRVVGKVTRYRSQLEFHHPDIYPASEEEVCENQLVPLYTETDGLSPQKLRKIINAALSSATVPDVLPEWVRSTYSLDRRELALKQIHEPPQAIGDQLLKFES